jgi:hypothetical protein
MEKPLYKPIACILERFSSSEGERKLEIAALWEDAAKGVSKDARVFKIENQMLFVKVANSLAAQELKLRVQRSFLEKYEKKFGEKLKDIRFLIGN